MRRVLAPVRTTGEMTDGVERTDRVEIEEVLEAAHEAYVANALAHGSPPYSLDIRRSEAEVTVRVRDAGPGIPDTFAPSLFETFTRATKEPAGSGLGLAIVKRLALAAGGEAWYEPNSPGGACFCVSFPARP